MPTNGADAIRSVLERWDISNRNAFSELVGSSEHFDARHPLFSDLRASIERILVAHIDDTERLLGSMLTKRWQRRRLSALYQNKRKNVRFEVEVYINDLIASAKQSLTGEWRDIAEYFNSLMD